MKAFIIILLLCTTTHAEVGGITFGMGTKKTSSPIIGLKTYHEVSSYFKEYRRKNVTDSKDSQELFELESILDIIYTATNPRVPRESFGKLLNKLGNRIDTRKNPILKLRMKWLDSQIFHVRMVNNIRKELNVEKPVISIEMWIDTREEAVIGMAESYARLLKSTAGMLGDLSERKHYVIAELEDILVELKDWSSGNLKKKRLFPYWIEQYPIHSNL